MSGPLAPVVDTDQLNVGSNPQSFRKTLIATEVASAPVSLRPRSTRTTEASM